MDDADWENGWKRFYQPIEIGNRLLILPDWMEPEPWQAERRILRVEPGLAFGTGSHATTRMCLEVLDGMDLREKKVLDLGCGSGILGIAALILDCKAASGCDIDPNARTAVENNASLNGLPPERFPIRIGNVISDDGLQRALGGDFDLVLANIVADVILPLSRIAARFLRPRGKFLCSGIIDSRASEIENALEKNGFRILRHLHEEEWNCYFSEYKDVSRETK